MAAGGSKRIGKKLFGYDGPEIVPLLTVVGGVATVAVGTLLYKEMYDPELKDMKFKTYKNEDKPTGKEFKPHEPAQWQKLDNPPKVPGQTVAHEVQSPRKLA